MRKRTSNKWSFISYSFWKFVTSLDIVIHLWWSAFTTTGIVKRQSRKSLSRRIFSFVAPALHYSFKLTPLTLSKIVHTSPSSLILRKVLSFSWNRVEVVFCSEHIHPKDSKFTSVSKISTVYYRAICVHFLLTLLLIKFL